MSDAAPSGAGAAPGSPGLPDGFANVFVSHWLDLGELRLDAVVGAHGPPLFASARLARNLVRLVTAHAHLGETLGAGNSPTMGRPRCRQR